MTRNEAIAIAAAKHNEACNAEWAFWDDGGIEPRRSDYGFLHGYFQIGEFSIGPDEYAPSSTYKMD